MAARGGAGAAALITAARTTARSMASVSAQNPANMGWSFPLLPNGALGASRASAGSAAARALWAVREWVRPGRAPARRMRWASSATVVATSTSIGCLIREELAGGHAVDVLADLQDDPERLPQ